MPKTVNEKMIVANTAPINVPSAIKPIPLGVVKTVKGVRMFVIGDRPKNRAKIMCPRKTKTKTVQ